MSTSDHTCKVSTPQRPPSNVSAESSMKSNRRQSRDKENVKPRLYVNGCSLAANDPSVKQGLNDAHNASAYATPTSSAMDETNSLPIKNTFIHFGTIVPPMRQSRKSWPMRRPDEVNINDHHMTSGEQPEPTPTTSDIGAQRDLERQKTALHNYEICHGMTPGTARREEVVNSSAGISGWAAFRGRQGQAVVGVTQDATSSAMDETNSLPIKNTFIHFDTDMDDTIVPAMRQSRKSWPMRRPDEVNINDHHMTSGETYGALGESRNDAQVVAAVLGSISAETEMSRNASVLLTGEWRVGGVRTDESGDLLQVSQKESAPSTEQLIDFTSGDDFADRPTPLSLHKALPTSVLRISDHLPSDVTPSSANRMLSPMVVPVAFFTVPTPSLLAALPVTPTQHSFFPAWDAP